MYAESTECGWIPETLGVKYMYARKNKKSRWSSGPSKVHCTRHPEVDLDSRLCFFCRGASTGISPGIMPGLTPSKSVMDDRDIILDLTSSPVAEKRLPEPPVPVSFADTTDSLPAPCLLEKLSAAVAALRMLDVFGDVLELENDNGRTFASLRLIGTGFDLPATAVATLSSRVLTGDWGADIDVPCTDSLDKFDFDRLNAAAISLNAVGGGWAGSAGLGVLSKLVRGEWAT